jgi:hypothetical protein
MNRSLKVLILVRCAPPGGCLAAGLAQVKTMLGQWGFGCPPA